MTHVKQLSNKWLNGDSGVIPFSFLCQDERQKHRKTIRQKLKHIKIRTITHVKYWNRCDLTRFKLKAFVFSIKRDDDDPKYCPSWAMIKFKIQPHSWRMWAENRLQCVILVVLIQDIFLCMWFSLCWMCALVSLWITTCFFSVCVSVCTVHLCVSPLSPLNSYLPPTVYIRRVPMSFCLLSPQSHIYHCN